jgi:hypothetical protein
LLLVIDGMAEKYGLLPSEVLEKATTMDLAISYQAGILKMREQKKQRGEGISDTYSESEILEKWNKVKGTKV